MRALLASLSLAALGSLAGAQTTGVPGYNDYTVNTLGSGATSCHSVSIPGGGPTLFEVSTPMPGMPVIQLFSLCPCTPCWAPLPESPCPLPYTACGVPGTVSNQSWDIDLICYIGNAAGVSGAGGIYSQILNLPPGIVFSTQAAVIDFTGLTCVSAPPSWILSQSHEISTI